MTLVSGEDNCLLWVPISKKVKDRVFAMDASSALDPDGFSDCLFSIVGQWLVMILWLLWFIFFRVGYVPSIVNSNFMVFLPKSKVLDSTN